MKGPVAAAAPILQQPRLPEMKAQNLIAVLARRGLMCHSQQLLQSQQLLHVPAGKRERGGLEGWEDRGPAVSMAALHLGPLLHTSCFSLIFWGGWGGGAIFRRTLRGCEAGKAWVEHRWGLWMQPVGEGVLQSCHAGMGGGGG